MVTCVNLFHFNLSVDEAMGEEVDVCFLHFGKAALMRDHVYDIIQR